jgi:DNA-binding CsgD family transcriptional regulator
MRIPNLGETELLIPLHDGMFEQPMWATFLERLRTVSGASHTALLFRMPGTDIPVQLGAGHSGSGYGADVAREAGLDLRRLFADSSSASLGASDLGLREERVYSESELQERLDPERRAVLHQIMASIKARHMLCVKIRTAAILDEQTDAVEAWLVLLAPGPFASSLTGMMSALAPHLQVAFKVFAGIERSRSHGSGAANALRHINIGWISVDRRCRILDHDDQAARFLAQSGVLRRGPYSRLYASAPEIDRQLTDLIKQFAHQPEARPRAITLAQDAWIDLLVAPVRGDDLVQPATDKESHAAAIVYFRMDENSSADRCQQLSDVFDLTESEARFAWSIAQGLSIKDASGQHGLTLETGRYYSKRIYSKTGALGQVDLMRRVLTSVLAL